MHSNSHILLLDLILENRDAFFKNRTYENIWSLFDLKPSPDTDLIHEIGFKTSKSIFKITNFKSFFRYLTLELLIIPAPKGWSLELVFFDKQTTLALKKQSPKLSGFYGALSMKSVIFLLVASILRSISVKTKTMLSVVIHAFWLN